MAFFIPALFDTLGGACLFMGLTQASACVYQMIRGFVVVITAALTVAVLKRKLLSNQITGIIFVISGVFFVGMTTYLSIQ